MNQHEDFVKYRTGMKHFLRGRGWTTALRAMHYAEDYHTGVRKDGETPEFFHQLSIATYVSTLSSMLIHPEETMAVIFLHDVVEDKVPTIADIRLKFGNTIATATDLVTNRDDRKIKLSNEVYYPPMANCPIASVVKGADRLHNQETMSGVFKDDYIPKYIQVTEDHIMPMLYDARKNFPEQGEVYTNLRHALKNQMNLIKYWVPRANRGTND